MSGRRSSRRTSRRRSASRTSRRRSASRSSSRRRSSRPSRHSHRHGRRHGRRGYYAEPLIAAGPHDYFTLPRHGAQVPLELADRYYPEAFHRSNVPGVPGFGPNNYTGYVNEVPFNREGGPSYSSFAPLSYKPGFHTAHVPSTQTRASLLQGVQQAHGHPAANYSFTHTPHQLY
jgi:hypothetical protein